MASVQYAKESFIGLLDLADSENTEKFTADAVRQIKKTADSVVRDIEISTVLKNPEKLQNLSDTNCAVTYKESGGRLLMQAVCRITSENKEYFLTVYSDFSEVTARQNTFWNRYVIAVIVTATVNGLLLFALALRITKPLNKLTCIADEIALGNYGKLAKVSTKDREIAVLAQSINAMSVAIEKNVERIKREAKNRDEFVANFTHEMKTPMTAIIGYAKMLSAYELDKEESDKATKSIYREAKRLEKLSQQLLEIYVLRNESVKLQPVSLAILAEQIESTLAFSGEKYGLNFSLEFDESTVLADETLIISLIYNLADNAFKASEKGGKVRIYSEVFGEKVKTCVHNFGKSIKPQEIKLLTEPFWREDKSRSRKLGGAGLGLTLCKEIARLHRTELHFESSEQAGTTAWIALEKGGATE